MKVNELVKETISTVISASIMGILLLILSVWWYFSITSDIPFYALSLVHNKHFIFLCAFSMLYIVLIHMYAFVKLMRFVNVILESESVANCISLIIAIAIELCCVCTFIGIGVYIKYYQPLLYGIVGNYNPNFGVVVLYCLILGAVIVITIITIVVTIKISIRYLYAFIDEKLGKNH